MRKDDVVSQIMVIALILVCSIIGGYALNPLLAVLGILMAVTSGCVTIFEHHIYQNEQEINEQKNFLKRKHVNKVAA